MSATRIRVGVRGHDPVVRFAADELARYLAAVTGRDIERGGDDQGAGFVVGLASDIPNVSAPRVDDVHADDGIVIDCREDQGVIAGVNPRSVLLAVYRYLTELGCRWVRPGPDGEALPRRDVLPEVRVSETPSYRHRAVCIEGAVAYEHVRDMIDWLPKVGLNGYFIQFREAHTFFNRWYSREGNPLVRGERLSPETAAEYTEGIEAEIRKRGLLYHKVGHGWTCEPFGLRGLGWETESVEPPPEVARYLAEIGGERKLWRGVALNTNLCYSNPEVRRIMSEAIAAYAEAHPDIDYLHVWLADGSNNNCECRDCQKARPSDFYVRLLNETDALLTRKKLATRIVFLIYVDLLWPPETERFENPDRFVLMFAPIARTYSETLRAGAGTPELPPFERNRLDFPKNVDMNVAFLRAWQQIFLGDSFDFDYHLMWDHLFDPGHMHIARTLGEDMKGLRAIGLNGFVSCQVQRLFLPTGLPMTVMARMLWDASADFQRIADDYFASAFGADGARCREYLERLSTLFNPPYLRGERPGRDKEAAANFAAVRDCLQSFRPVIERNAASPDPCHAQSWRYLLHHGEIAGALAEALRARAEGDRERAAALWNKASRLAWENEPEIHPVFDSWLFGMTLERRLFR